LLCDFGSFALIILMHLKPLFYVCGSAARRAAGRRDFFVRSTAVNFLPIYMPVVIWQTLSSSHDQKILLIPGQTITFVKVKTAYRFQASSH
jgi:hypothetical protein